MNEFQYLIEYFEQFPPMIQFIWVLSGILFMIVVILIAYLKFLRNYLRSNEKTVKQYEKEYELLLVTFLYSGNVQDTISPEQQKIIDQLKISIADKFKREIIISLLLKLNDEISGEIAELLQRLYIHTGLKDYALTKLKHKSWYIVAKGIRELTQLHIANLHDDIVVHVNHPKSEVRKEVRLYLVILFRFKRLEFLNDLKTPLSEWDQIQILEVLQRFDDQQIPDISLWLRSSNDSVVSFVLKLAKIYNQFEVKDDLLELLSHSSEKIRIEVIHVLIHLQVFEAKDILKKDFKNRTTEEQLAVFKMLENLFDSDDEPFLMEHVYNENFEIRLSALKILKIFNSEALRSLKLESPDAAYTKIVEFVENN